MTTHHANMNTHICTHASLTDHTYSKQKTHTCLTPDEEEKIGSDILKRKFAESADGRTAVFKRPGKPFITTKTLNPKTPSEECATSTLRKRSLQIAGFRERVSCCSSTRQQLDELKHLRSDAEVTDLLQSGGALLKIPTTDLVELKSFFNLSWTRLRKLKKWLYERKISTANEQDVREAHKHIIQDNLVGAWQLLHFYTEEGHAQEIRRAPIVTVKSIKDKVFSILDEYNELNQLTWHDGAIPTSEVWLKLGGDKGADTFKMMVGKQIRLFMFGDYEFLTKIYGLTGPNGRHCCLYCKTTKKDMAVPEKVHEERTLATMKESLEKFREKAVAKECYNVIRPPVFNIPLDQVCPPGLHLSLGIFLKLYVAFERECHALDMAMAGKLRPETALSKTRANFPIESGPVVCGVEKVLQDLSVHRQAYHGKSFVGNHIHKCLKPTNIDRLTGQVEETVRSLCPALHDESKAVAVKYNAILKLYGRCHSAMNAGYFLPDHEIDELEDNIKGFFTCFRTDFHGESTTPKLHIMEMHVVPWLRRWHAGLGVMGEQGGESVHVQLNTIMRDLRGFTNDLTILEHAVKAQWIQSSPHMYAKHAK
ncbi:uncharacterized protein [Diadema antillarum]|uniref:uncharacterized protein n=1 Tax=Diadema antillarum TaxID=105358 RepID=UPI003A84AD7B